MDLPPAVVPLCRTGAYENFTWAAAGVAMRPRTATARMPGCFMGKLRKRGAISLRHGSHAVNPCDAMASENGEWAPPNGSRLSCGRRARRHNGGGRQSAPRQGANTPFPLKRSPPASFKRLLGAALRHAVSWHVDGAAKPRVYILGRKNPL